MKYEIMHIDTVAACIDLQGRCKIYNENFLPYNLYLEEGEDDIDTLVNNISNFYYWCATRVLPLDRQYAKEILNSVGATQAVTDRDRAGISLAYRCLTLTDVFWVRKQGENVTFAEVNLYDHHLNDALVYVALRGKQMTLNNEELAHDLSTNGYFPKAWIRDEMGFKLLKDGGTEVVEREILASKISRCFDCVQVAYEEDVFDGEKVSVSDIMTSKKYSIVSREAFDIYAVNHDLNAIEYILDLDAHSYYMMNIIDYLVGNTDRHLGNWGVLIDNETNKPVALHPLMDFNQSFNSYDSIDGANCQTVLPKILNQREAALEAVKHIGLNQICEIDAEWFKGRESEYEMFLKRLEVLKEIEKQHK